MVPCTVISEQIAIASARFSSLPASQSQSLSYSEKSFIGLMVVLQKIYRLSCRHCLLPGALLGSGHESFSHGEWILKKLS